MEFMPDGTIKQTLEVPPILALLPIRDLVVFPYMVVPLMVSREMSVAASLPIRPCCTRLSEK